MICYSIFLLVNLYITVKLQLHLFRTIRLELQDKCSWQEYSLDLEYQGKVTIPSHNSFNILNLATSSQKIQKASSKFKLILRKEWEPCFSSLMTLKFLLVISNYGSNYVVYKITSVHFFIGLTLVSLGFFLS